MEMSYNPNIHTKAGVQSILSNTFMSGSVRISATVEDTSVKAKQDGGYIYVTPETTNEQVASAIGMTNFQVKTSNNKSVPNNAKAATGNIFVNKTYDTEYTIIVPGDVNGDGEVKSADFAMVRAAMLKQTALNNVQKKAADINGDGEVRATDFARVRSHMLRETLITIKGSMTTLNSNMSYADIIMKAAEESGISPYSIAIKIIQEVGSKGSGSVTGTYSGYQGYYNFYNWGATDGNNAVEKGLIYAKEMGWNNQYTAIVEGAKKLADSYVSVGQNTAYFYKFDCVDDVSTGLYWHQYMTNVQDPSSQASSLYNTYAKNNILDISLNFVIPVFNDMPSSCLLPTTINTSNPNSYYVNGTGVRFRSGPSTGSGSIGTFSLGETVTVLNLSAGNSNGYTWAEVKRQNGQTGYIANCYLTKC